MRRWLLGLAAVIVIPGCSRSEFDLAPATGTVTIDGQPFTQGKVIFSPVAKGDQRIIGKAAFGKLQPDGTFTLSTYEENDGAVAGDHWASLVHIVREGETSSLPAAVPPFEKVTYPTRFTVVSGEDNKFELAFTSDVIKKYARQAD